MNEFIDIRKLRRMPLGDKAVVKEGSHSLFELFNREFHLGSPVTDKFKEAFYTELAVLLQAGVDIRTALELIQEEYKKKLKLIISQLLKQVVNGSSLSSAVKETKGFSGYEYHSLCIGEETGKLGRVLSELAQYFSKRIRQRRQVIGALTYPAIVLSVSVGAISFMLTYVVPMFSDIFKKSGDDLPAVTTWVLALSNNIKQYGGLFLLLLAGAVTTCIWQREKKWFRKSASELLLKMPIWGKLIQKIYLARFTSTMAMLLSAKIPMLRAIGLTKQVIGLYPLEKLLSEVEEKIVNGKSLHHALSDYHLLPSKLKVMVKVGEEVNELEAFFKKLSEQYSNEIEHSMGVLSKLIEPVIIIFLGFIVGLVLIAMYLPLFKLGQHF